MRLLSGVARSPCAGHAAKGAKLPKPEDTVARTRRRQQRNVAWYGGGRDIAVVSDTGHWYKAKRSPVPVHWV